MQLYSYGESRCQVKKSNAGGKSRKPEKLQKN